MNKYINRKKTNKVNVGNISIGGDSKIVLQSMTNIPVENVKENLLQIENLKKHGAELVRLAVRNENGIKPLSEIIKLSPIPLVADIHFDHRLAIAAINAGISKIRINPGNIGDEKKVREVVKAASEHNVPIRIGVNGGSINKKKYHHVTPESLVDSAMENILILEDNNFDNIVVSIKCSDIFTTIEANKLFSNLRDYPIHIGLTEAGYGLSCITQSAIVIGHLLMNGIGDTIRVSMTGDPVNEAVTGSKILESLDLKFSPIRIISCPTCGRTATDIDILTLSQDVERELNLRFGENLTKRNERISVAIMGCEVNGPGEASEADFGLAGGQNGKMLLFAKGERIKTISINGAVKELVDTIAEKYLS
ncbi:MAG: flavodoxin-dependent (E)-4-hydroxy-3-methylbut-2-enyl-diphosphate synthase [Spirochaetes bacterium]|nr:flavodoxin-dependent (E)-4-hydroxy-3-methylbut-2-enyl-diphosphate synthase [Spirochaetota bacterium]